MLLKFLSHISPFRGMPVDNKNGSSGVTAITGETVQLYYYTAAGVLTSDAGQAAGVAVVGKLARNNIKNSLNNQQANKDDTSLSFTSTALTTEVEVNWAKIHSVDGVTGLLRLTKIVEGMSNGQYCVDYATGTIYGKKASTATTLTSTAYKVNTLDTALTVWDRVLGVWKSLQNNLFFFRGMGTHFTPNDGTAAFTSTTTITCAGFPFTVDDTYCDVLSIVYKPTGGLWTILENGKDGVSMVAASNVITVTGASTPFASGDTYRVAIRYQNKGYNAASNSGNTTESNPLSQQYVELELIDTTNVAAATNYYPSADGQVMDGYSTLWLQGMTSGGVTTTIEATLDDASSPDFLDITPYFSNMIVNPNAVAASYVDVNFLIRALDLRVKKWRVKSVTSDGTNAVQYHAKMTSI